MSLMHQGTGALLLFLMIKTKMSLLRMTEEDIERLQLLGVFLTCQIKER